MPPTLEQRRFNGSLGGLVSWANTENRTARTANGRAAAEQRFLDLAGGDPKRAATLRKLHFKRMAQKSAEARRRKAGKS